MARSISSLGGALHAKEEPKPRERLRLSGCYCRVEIALDLLWIDGHNLQAFLLGVGSGLPMPKSAA